MKTKLDIFKPEDKGLGEPVKKFSETFSFVTALKEKYFPEQLTVDKDKKL